VADDGTHIAISKQEEGEHDPQFEPVIKLTEQVDTKTHEEDEDVLFKLRAKLFRFDMATSEWKERGTGDVRLLAHKENKKVRLVMRRDKTLKVCANHHITSDMNLQPNIGSDRSWVWKVAADFAENEPTSETLAIRFANSENANGFKTAFDNAKQANAEIAAKAAAPPTAPSPPPPSDVPAEKEEEHKTVEESKDEATQDTETAETPAE